MKYKTFKDIEIGDCLYSYNKNINKIYRFPITKIIKDKLKVRFYFSKDSWDYIAIRLEDLEFNKINNLFADINLLFSYINEDV